ncbi:MAG TPA: nucleoside diphosphate kinase regulator, partial [Reyranella sp.]|nr:nucleoside diphosphate kinase regulator [Reyranella sp.]
MATRTRSTHLIVSNAEYERLTDLASASMERLPDVAQELLDELERAQIVDDKDVPKDVVRMG